MSQQVLQKLVESMPTQKHVQGFDFQTIKLSICKGKKVLHLKQMHDRSKLTA